MKEFIDKTTENLEEKIKVTSLEIIVTGTKDKPYFEIKYREVGKEDYSIGYSSYDLNYVFAWKEECFEIVNELAEEYKGGWIPLTKQLPEYGQYVLACVPPKDGINGGHPVVIMEFREDNEPLFYRFVSAWQPLPAPYTEGE